MILQGDSRDLLRGGVGELYEGGIIQYAGSDKGRGARG